MVHKYQQFVPKPPNLAELRRVLEVVWDDLPHESIRKAVLAFRKERIPERLQACCQSEGGHFEHVLRPKLLVVYRLFRKKRPFTRPLNKLNEKSSCIAIASIPYIVILVNFNFSIFVF
jgi:hypothetical protein